jgi:hypothetical protein
VVALGVLSGLTTALEEDAEARGDEGDEEWKGLLLYLPPSKPGLSFTRCIARKTKPVKDFKMSLPGQVVR